MVNVGALSADVTLNLSQLSKDIVKAKKMIESLSSTGTATKTSPSSTNKIVNNAINQVKSLKTAASAASTAIHAASQKSIKATNSQTKSVTQAVRAQATLLNAQTRATKSQAQVANAAVRAQTAQANAQSKAANAATKAQAQTANAAIKSAKQQAQAAAQAVRAQAQLLNSQNKTSRGTKVLGTTAIGAGRQILNAMGNSSKATKNFSEHVMNARGYLKDAGKVASGIIISQAFYAIVRAVKDAAKALFDFNSLLERTQVAFKYLIGDVGLAKKLIADLQTIAAKTPHTFETAVGAAKTLLALGFTEDQLRPLINIMADLNAATGGDADQMDQLAYALGKVQAMGKMTTRELKLFATAKIPIYDILREQLGLTEKDFVKLRISASEAIPAILAGIMKFKGAAEEMEKTIPGLLSSIHDYLLFLGQDIMNAPFLKLREILTDLRNRVMMAREAFKTGGLRAAIAELLPRGMVTEFYRIFASITLLINKFKELWAATLPLRKILVETFLTTLLTAVEVVKKFIDIIEKSLGGMALFVKALLAFLVAQKVVTLISSLTVALKAFFLMLTTNPIGAAVALLAGAIVYLGLSAASAQQSMYGLGGTMVGTAQKAGALSNYIQGATKSLKTLVGIGAGGEKPVSLVDLINGFGDTSDAIDDVGTSAQKAAKKIKDTFLAGFDEVYQIPEAVDDIADSTDGLGAGLGGGTFDFGKFNDLFAEKTYPFGKITEETSGLLARKTVPGLTKKTHEEVMADISEKNKYMPTVHKKGYGKAGVTGENLFDSVENFGTGIQQFDKAVGEGLAYMAEDIKKEGGGLGGVIKSFSKNWNGMWGGLEDPHSMQSAIRRDMNYPAAGAAISGLFDGATWKETFKEAWEDTKSGWKSMFTTPNGPQNQSIDQLMKPKKTSMFGTEKSDLGINKQWDESLTKINKTIGDTFANIPNMSKIAWDAVKNFGIEAWDNITQGAIQRWETVKNWAIGVWENITQGAIQRWETVKAWAIGVWESITQGAIQRWETVKAWAIGVWESITQGAMQRWDKVKAWAIGVWESITQGAMTRWTTVTTWATTKWNEIKKKATDVWDAIKTWATGIWTSIYLFVESTWNKIYIFATGIWDTIHDWATDKWDALLEKAKSIWNSIRDWAKGIWDEIVRDFVHKWNAVVPIEALKIEEGKSGGAGYSGGFGAGNVGNTEKPGDKGKEAPKKPKGYRVVGSAVIPYYAKGGIVTKDQIARVGEKGPEAVVPLNERSLAPLAQMISNLMNNRQNDGFGMSTPMIIGTLIADDKGIKELERRRYKIMRDETLRRGSY